MFHYWSIFVSKNKNATSNVQHLDNLLDTITSLNKL